MRLALGMALAAVVILPLVADSALANRITGAVTGADQESTPEHTERSREAFDAVVANPLGQGLASSGNVANRFAVRGALLPENYYLQVALDVGVIGALVFVGVVISAARPAHRRARRTDHLLDAAAASALAATALAGLFLGSFAVITTAMPLMVAVGLATAPAEPDEPKEPSRQRRAPRAAPIAASAHDGRAARTSAGRAASTTRVLHLMGDDEGPSPRDVAVVIVNWNAGRRAVGVRRLAARPRPGRRGDRRRQRLDRRERRRPPSERTPRPA